MVARGNAVWWYVVATLDEAEKQRLLLHKYSSFCLDSRRIENSTCIVVDRETFSSGSAFALLSCTETLTFLAATAVFLALYPATLPVYHGFCWLFAAGIVLIPITLVT